MFLIAIKFTRIIVRICIAKFSEITANVDLFVALISTLFLLLKNANKTAEKTGSIYNFGGTTGHSLNVFRCILYYKQYLFS